MKYNLLKRLGKMLLSIPLIYSLNSHKLIAPGINYIPIKQPEELKEDTRKIIVIDPGHGMENRAKDLMDWGKTYKEYKEAEIVLEKAKKIKEILDSTKYKVILTRNNNETPCPIESRPELANKVNADIFLSLHLNDFENWKSISGSEVYWRYKKDKDLAKLAAKNLDEIAKIPNRYVSWGEYLMLKEVKCPAALVELGYILNDEDRDKILNNEGVEKAIVKTIEEVLK